MRAGIFQFMNDAVKLINSRNKFINFVAEEAKEFFSKVFETNEDCLLYTSDAADDAPRV